MRIITTIAILIIIFSSCSKKNDLMPIPDPVTPAIPDTLGAGWAVKNVTPGNPISDIFFTDSNNGYLVSRAGIYKSTDAGNTWVQKNPSASFYNIAAWGNNAFFVQTGLQPLVTNNGGNTFQSITPFATGDVPTDCFYSSLNNCHVAATSSNHKSIDGGQSFTFQYTFPNSNNYGTLFFLNDVYGWTLKSDKLYKTINGGTNWTVVSNVSGNQSAVEFIDLNTGYYSNQLGVYKTTNGGTNWQQVFFNSRMAYTDIDFVSPTEGFLSTVNQIYRTTNSGTTWSKVVGLGNTNIIEIHFTDATHGWACCENGSILKFN